MNRISRDYFKELKQFVFNHTHKFSVAFVYGGIEEVGVVFAKENRGK